MVLFVSLIVLSYLAFLIHFLFFNKEKNFARGVELLLLYQLVVVVGIMGFLSFYAQRFLPDVVANHLGWQTTPFQEELSNIHLGYGVLGIMSIWFRGNFWTAIVIGSAFWWI